MAVEAMAAGGRPRSPPADLAVHLPARYLPAWLLALAMR